MGRAELYELTKAYHEKDLEALLKRKNLSIYYKNSHTMVGSENDIHFVDSMGLHELDIEKLLFTESKLHTHDRTKSRAIARRLAPYFKEYQLPQDFASTLSEQLKDEEFRQLAAVQTLKYYNPGQEVDPAEIRFDVNYLDGYYFTIDTNIDFGKFSKTDKKSPILALINTAEDLFVMADHSTEISVPEFNSMMMRGKIKAVLDKTEKSEKEREVFNHYVFDNSKDFRRMINEGKVGMNEILSVLDKADKFKDWLQKLPEDGNLMREFTNAITAKSIFEHGHAKSVRFYLLNTFGILLTAAAPAIGIPTTIALNAFDTFLLERLGKKWNPNQFVNETLRPLIKP